MSTTTERLVHLGNLVVPLVCFGIIALVLGPIQDFVQTLGESEYAKLLTPAGFTFAIWGPIFLFMGAWVAYQSQDLVWPAKRFLTDSKVADASPWFMLSTVFTSGWYLTWVLGLVWPAIALMYLYLGSILVGYLQLDINRTTLDRRSRLVITTGWSLYAGWVTAATIVNTSTGVVSLAIPFFMNNQLVWSLVVLTLTLIIYLVVFLTRQDYIFAGVGIWVLIGVLGDQLLFRAVPVIEIVVLTVIGLVGLMLLMIYLYQTGFPQRANFDIPPEKTQIQNP
jgi:hypothetical protein